MTVEEALTGTDHNAARRSTWWLCAAWERLHGAERTADVTRRVELIERELVRRGFHIGR